MIRCRVSGYELCYLDGRRVSLRRSCRSASIRPTDAWRQPAGCAWGRSVFAAMVVLCWSRSASPISRCTRAGTRSRTACSGAVARRRRHGRRSGGRLAGRPRGHRARRHSPGGQRDAGRDAGRRHRVSSIAAHDGTRLAYTLLRARHAASRSRSTLAPAPRGSSMYFVLAAVGLFTLLVGASVRLRRPRDQATLHFFWLCVAFFGAFTFSFNGPFDRLDWVFYWGDAVAMALLPPLLLHFTLVFPERRPGDARGRTRRSGSAGAADVPAGPGARRRRAIVAVARSRGSQRDRCSRGRSTRSIALEPLYLFALCGRRASSCWCAAFRRDHVAHRPAPAALDCLGHGARRRAVRASATRCPWALGVDPPFALQLTAIPLGFVPLTFASAIVRYRLRDVEVIIKRGLAYTAFLAASVALYLAMLQAGRRSSSPNDADGTTGSSRCWRRSSSCCWRSR